MAFYSTTEFTPDCSIGYLARRIHQLGLVALEPIFAEEGITAIQWSALISVWCQRGTTCAELARDLSHDKGAMTRLVDALEQRGWLTRDRNADDRRVINLALTDEGRELALRCRLRVIAYWNIVLKDWDKDEATMLIALMQKLRLTLDSVALEGAAA